MELPSPLVRSSIILALTFGGCALRKVPFLPLDRPTICLLGGLATVLTGVLSVDEAFASMKLDVIALLLGMMLLAGGLFEAGFYERVARPLASTARDRPRLLIALILGGTALTASLVTNDTVCVFFAPLVITITRAGKRRPMPYLLALALAANTGSAATFVGNPQNMIVGVDAARDPASRLTFARYALLATPIALAGLAIAYGALVFVFRRELGPVPEVDGQPAPLESARFRPVSGEEARTYDPWLAATATTALVVTGMLLLANKPLALAALVGSAILLAFSRRDPRLFYPHIDIGLLVLFGGLFVVTKGAEHAKVIDVLAARFAPDAKASFAGQASSMALFTTVGSQIVSNVPFVLATTPWLGKLASPDAHRALLALVSTFAGNLTLLGSVANLIVAGAAKDDEPMGFVEHLKVGLPVTLLQVVLATLAVIVFVKLGLL